MHAQRLTQVNAPLQLTELPAPQPAPQQVVVQLKAAALNHRDVWIQKGMYPGIKPPVTPGSDGAGEVEGRAVIINPNIQWGDSERHQSRQYHILGLPTDGTFAEQVVVGEDRLADKPDHLSWTEAAALPLGGLTAYRAVFTRGRLQAGERVLISGVGGGVALFACQFAVAAGAEVWVTSSQPEKIEKARKLGAKGGANYREERWHKTFKKEAGEFDLIIDSAGGEGFTHLVDLAKSGGRIVFYGGTRGTIPLSPQKVFWKQLDLLGSTMGSDQDFRNMIAFVKKHRIHPVVDRVFPLAQANEALAYMDAGKQFGKIVLECR